MGEGAGEGEHVTYFYQWIILEYDIQYFLKRSRYQSKIN